MLMIELSADKENYCWSTKNLMSIATLYYTWVWQIMAVDQIWTMAYKLRIALMFLKHWKKEKEEFETKRA